MKNVKLTKTVLESRLMRTLETMVSVLLLDDALAHDITRCRPLAELFCGSFSIVSQV